MKIACIIVDDEPLALDVLSSLIARVPYLVLEGQYTDPFLAMEHLRKHPVDLLFVDIQMPDITGIELVRTLTNPPKVVFTTAYSSYAVEGFNLNAMDCIDLGATTAKPNYAGSILPTRATFNVPDGTDALINCLRAAAERQRNAF